MGQLSDRLLTKPVDKMASKMNKITMFLFANIMNLSYIFGKYY